MKKIIIINALLYTLIGTGLLQANPPAIDVFNISKASKHFVLKLVHTQGKSAPVTKGLTVPVSTTEKPATPYEAPSDYNTIQSIRVHDTNIILDLQQYSEKVGVVYDGNVLKEESDYKLYKASKYTGITRRAAVVAMAALYTYIVSTGAILRTWWNKRREGGTPELMPSGLEQIEVHNHMPFAITVVGAGAPQTIETQQSHTFVKTLTQLDIYNAPALETLLDIIELKKYTTAWKAGHNLIVTITPPGWWAQWRGKKINYTIEWRADVLPPQTALGTLEEEQ